MKKLVHKFISVIMAVVVLLTTMSFSIDMHYCGDMLVDFSIVEQVKSCGMEKVKTDCDNLNFTQKSCCTDTQLIVEGADNMKASFDQLSFEQQIFITSFTYSYINLFAGIDSNTISLKYYSPPFVKQDVQVLHQLFLI
ncbi:hypothetical protein LCGC14_0118780 [marine sediment metagenome]|uniref:Uncharacterized protein n=1 Tax=marine sediment metagenome TaxID=412755 RepID=A0A0F9VBA6_9ZZZZ|nr:hypothetical protein [Maribacter sp.]HDZ07383.1 hypothetical protein [Maribacter sp.]HEA81088.1 hypothetical protein [Maribacter sp.]